MNAHFAAPLFVLFTLTPRVVLSQPAAEPPPEEKLGAPSSPGTEKTKATLPPSTPSPPAEKEPVDSKGASSVPAEVRPTESQSANEASAREPDPPVEDAPEGRAAPPTESARGAGPVRVGLEVFAQYSYRNTGGTTGERTWFHQFDLPRAHGAVEGEWQRVRGRLVLEAVRSASEGALIGVSGDSLVLRIREAYAAYRPIDSLEVSAGVVPLLTVPELDGTWMLRAVAPSAVEAGGYLAAADLGVKARYDLPRGYGFVALAASNGEGYTNRELNRGKNLEGAFEVHPVPRGALLPLGVFFSYAAGSSGTLLARANRATGGVVWQGARVRAGAFMTHAWGVAEYGEQRALVVSAFLRVEPLRRWLLGARLDHTVRDLDAPTTNAVTSIGGTVGYRILAPLETFLAVTRNGPTAAAQNDLPGSHYWELRAIARVVF